MRASGKLYRLLEGVLGRRRLWRIGRWLYLGARRELSNRIEDDGELDLLDWVARDAARSEDPVFLDVGARLGDWSLRLADRLDRHGAAGARILAFEPGPSQRAELAKSVAGHRTGVAVRIFDCAVAASVGTVTFELTHDLSGSNAIVSDAPLRDGSRLIEVAVTTVDAVMEEHGIGRVAMLKIDTEGNDFNVILGARQALMRTAIDVVQFEYGPRWLGFGHALQQVMRLALDTGYDFGRLTPDGIEIYDTWHRELDRFVLANFILIAPDACPSVPRIRMRFDTSNVAVRV